MRCGISTACFYPLDTLESLKILADSGTKVIELFFNTFSELEDPYVAKLLDVTKAYGMDISSLHPFTALMEGFFFASEYATRLSDGLDIYRRYFEVCQLAGADKLVFHGDHDYNVDKFPAPVYAHNFHMLAEEGRQYGVTVCHENVAYCRLNAAERVRELRPLLQRDSAFVLDFKQCRRRGVDIDEMMHAMGTDIRQVHISDGVMGQNCLPPGTGDMDFAAAIRSLRSVGYNGDLIIELYSDNYKEASQLVKSMDYINSVLHGMGQDKEEESA